MSTPSTAPDELLGELLDGYAPIETFAAALNRHPKSVRRLGLPFIKVGSQRWIHVETARAMLTGRLPPVPVLPPPRGRGRPRKG